jgi:hypothetical protein
VSAEDLRSRYVSVLLDRFFETRYPSSPLLDRIEAAISDRESAEDYVGRLIETVKQERYPSPMMLERLNRLIGILESQ